MNEYKNPLPLLTRFTRHFSTITRHKFWVAYYCFKVGLYKQGITHDLSKYSPSEFIPGVKYFQGHRSPIDQEKEIFGYSNAWFHHFGTNKHHWEHYIDLDRVNNQLKAYKMEDRYILESICDRVAACRIYQGKNFDKDSAYNYFMKGKDRIFMHPDNSKTFEYYLYQIALYGFDGAIDTLKQLNHK